VAKSRTIKSKYPSTCAPECWITQAQFLTEKLCINVAKRKGQRLEGRFWQDAEWKKFFQGQVCYANKLLKSFEFDVILNVLEANKWITSLRAGFILKFLAEENLKAQYKLPIIRVEVEDNTEKLPRATLKTKNNSLRKLDG
jgi:hypothetical protein